MRKGHAPRVQFWRPMFRGSGDRSSQCEGVVGRIDSDRLIGRGVTLERRCVLAVSEVADLDVRLSAGQAEAVLGDVDLHPAPDDVTPGPQPGTLLELEAQRHGLRKRAV